MKDVTATAGGDTVGVFGLKITIKEELAALANAGATIIPGTVIGVGDGLLLGIDLDGQAIATISSIAERSAGEVLGATAETRKLARAGHLIPWEDLRYSLGYVQFLRTLIKCRPGYEVSMAASSWIRAQGKKRELHRITARPDHVQTSHEEHLRHLIRQGNKDAAVILENLRSCDVTADIALRRLESMGGACDMPA